MNQKPTLCFIGAGFHATTNILPAAIEAGVVIQAIATRSIDRSKAALQRFGSDGTPYDDYRLMLEQEACAGVVIVAQPDDQFAIALDCVKAGKHVYVEKPLGWNAEEATQIAEAAEQAGVSLMVGFMKRYAPCYRKLKELLTDNTLGQARSFQAKFLVDSTPFCRDDEQFLKLAAIHLIDLIRYLFGEVAHVAGFRNSEGASVSHTLSLQFESGVVGSVYLAGMSAWSRETESVLITFDHGYASAEDIETVTIHQALPSAASSWKSLAEQTVVLTHSASTMSGGVKDLHLRGFVDEMAHFMQCCQTGGAPLSSGGDNVGTMELCERIMAVLRG
ncbi:UNVERIFIED_CONTAM: UDP-N-acetylglucosamine 3-dehydrogenase [Brevibacillus sp. OAP136]